MLWWEVLMHEMGLVGSEDGELIRGSVLENLKGREYVRVMTGS